MLSDTSILSLESEVGGGEEFGVEDKRGEDCPDEWFAGVDCVISATRPQLFEFEAQM